MSDNEVLTSVLASVRSRITQVFPAQVRDAVAAMTDEELWWRPNEEANAVGNLVLHLSGSLNHYLNFRIGGIEYARDRAAEFAERRTIPRAELLATFDEMVTNANRTFESLSVERLGEPSPSPELQTLLVEDLINICAHFATHAGQILWIVKMLHAGSLDEVWSRTHKRLGGWRPRTPS
jgi:hypothetical protein